MMLTDPTATEFFQSLLASIKKNGVLGTYKMLKSDSIEVDIEEGEVRDVIEIVCDEFSISVDELIYDKYIRGDNKYAIGFCLFYLYHNYSVGEIQSKGAFKYKDKSVLSRYRQLISKLDSKNQADIPYLKIKSRLDKKINNIKK
jgi:hypothetical protein